MSERVSPRKCGDGAALGRLVESGMSDECALTSGALRDARLDFPRAGGYDRRSRLQEMCKICSPPRAPLEESPGIRARSDEQEYAMLHTTTTARSPRSMMRRTAAALGATIMLSACAWSNAGLPASADETTEDARDSDVILNMFQWSWTSVAEECGRHHRPAGFGYVQVSPQEEIRSTEWWTFISLSATRSKGRWEPEEFAEMVQKCDEAGVGVIADAVINHTTGADRAPAPAHRGILHALDDFPGIYGPEHFNDCREDISDYTDRDNVQNCRLSSLQDLATGSEEVQDTLAAYMNDLLDMGVEGFRIDAAKHMPAEDLAAIKSKLSDPDVYWVQEVIGAAGEPIQPSEYTGTGDVHEFDYGRQLKSAFGGSIAGLDSIAEGKLDSEDAGVFVDNHDTERNGETLNYKDGDTYTLANDFMLAYDYGRPSVYTGYTFEDHRRGRTWVHRHRGGGCLLRRRGVDLHAAAAGDPGHGLLPQRSRGYRGHRLVGRRRQQHRLRARGEGLRRAEQHRGRGDEHLPQLVAGRHLLQHGRRNRLHRDGDRCRGRLVRGGRTREGRGRDRRRAHGVRRCSGESYSAR